MVQSVKEVLDAAMQLSPQDREVLIEHLLCMVEPQPNAEIDQAWGEEIARRLDDIDSGRVEMIPGDEVMKRLRRITRGESADG